MKGMPIRRNSECKGPEVGHHQMCSINSSEQGDKVRGLIEGGEVVIFIIQDYIGPYNK